MRLSIDQPQDSKTTLSHCQLPMRQAKMFGKISAFSSDFRLLVNSTATLYSGTFALSFGVPESNLIAIRAVLSPGLGRLKGAGNPCSLPTDPP